MPCDGAWPKEKVEVLRRVDRRGNGRVVTVQIAILRWQNHARKLCDLSGHRIDSLFSVVGMQRG